MTTAISVRNLSKRYSLGEISSGTLFRDFERWRARVLGRPDPYARIGEAGRRGAGEEFWALRDVSFDVRQGEVLGIIGRNGAGKSTLLKVLSRVTAPTAGEVKVRGRIASLLEVGTGFHPELTGRENIYLNGTILGMTKAEIRRKFDEIVAFAGVEQFIDTPVKRYSSGMYVRLAFAVAAHLEPEILVIDEVLAVGDAEFQKKCLGKMGEVARGGRTVLFVSHNMAAVESLCSHAVWLHDGGLRHAGDTERIVQLYLSSSVTSAADRHFPDHTTAPGNERIRLRRARVTNSADPAQPITMVTPLQVEFEYWNLCPDTRLNLSLHVHTAEGTLVFNTAPVHDVDWLAKPFPAGLFRSTVQIPGYLLNSGTYRIDALFVENQSHVIWHMDEALTFDVAEAIETRGAATWYGKWPGVVHPRLEWRTEQLG